MPLQAIVSDIHANKIALERVLEDTRSLEINEVVCLGDVVGYGPDPVTCIDLVRESCAWSLCGNHEMAMLMRFAPCFNKAARDALRWQKKQIRANWFSQKEKRERWQWLKHLEPSRTVGRVLYVHASPRDPLMEYIQESDAGNMGFAPSPKLAANFSLVKWLAFCGHTHRPGIMTQEGLWIDPADLEDETYPLPALEKSIVNVGSVGQPRDGNPDACYVILDLERKTVRFRRVSYDVVAAQKRFEGITDLDERNSQRLLDGR